MCPGGCSGRGRRFFTAALFALLGPTLHLGAFATYDALSLFLLALAAWCVTGAGERGEATGRMAGAGLLLALANADGLFLGPVRPGGDRPGGVHRLAGRAAGGGPALRDAAERHRGLLIGGVLIGGSSYLTGISQTTLAAGSRQRPRADRALRAWSWTGMVVVLALCAVFTSWAPARTATAPGCWRCWPRPRCSGRWSRRTCTPPPH